MPFVFDHIFKTGGTTVLGSYVVAAFPSDERFIINGLVGPNQEDLKRLIELSDDEKRRIRMIGGHNAGQLRGHYRDARFITLVRDPVPRAISAYLHCRFHPDAWEPIGREMEERRIGLAEFVESDLFAKRYADFVSVHDWQAKVILGPAVASETLDERQITRIIGPRFHLVGYTEALELFLFCLHVDEGLPLLLFNNRLVRKEVAELRVTHEDIATIHAYNRLDTVVYRSARRAFDRHLRDIWAGSVARRYREYRNALDRFRDDTGGDVNAVAPFVPNSR